MRIAKRIVAGVVATVLALSVTACGGQGGKTKKAFEESNAAYDNVNSAYQIVDKMSGDIYEAWRLGIYEDDKILKDGVTYLAKELSLSESELRDGVSYVINVVLDDADSWDDVSAEDKKEGRDLDVALFKVMEDSLFSVCVEVVKGAYIVNGQVDKAKGYLDDAKEQMKALSENYSDYEHYPSLKGYYTKTASYYDFCVNPDGSFEQIKTTIETYRTDCRNYNSDLSYIFED